MGQLSDAVSDIISVKRQKGLDDANTKWQNELRGRQRTQWTEEDAGKAAMKEANEAAAKHLSERLKPQEAQPSEAPPMLTSGLGAPSLDQPVTLEAPAQQGQWLSLSGAPAAPAEQGAGLMSAQPAQDPAGAGMSIMGGQGAFAKPLGVTKIASPVKVSEGQAIFEAASKRGDVLLKHGRYDDYMANHAKQAEIGTRLMAQAAQQADAAYQQTGDPTEYIKRMAPYANTGIDFVSSTRAGADKDGNPIWSVTSLDTSTGKESTTQVSEAKIIENANKLRDPKYAQELALKSGIAQVQARAKMEQDNNASKNKKGLQDSKAVDEVNLEDVKQKGRLSLNNAHVSGQIKVKERGAGADGAIRPKDQIAAIDSDRKGITSRLNDLHKDYQTELKDPNLEDNQRASLRQAYERQVGELDKQGKELDQRRSILYRNLKLDGGSASGEGQGLASAKPAGGSKKVTGTKEVSAFRAEAAAAIAKGKDPKAVAARFNEMTGQNY